MALVLDFFSGYGSFLLCANHCIFPETNAYLSVQHAYGNPWFLHTLKLLCTGIGPTVRWHISGCTHILYPFTFSFCSRI